VVDVGWYRTTIRSFDREIFIIPNSVFSRNVVLNITRKNKEWRFHEVLSLRLEDLRKASDVVSDMRKILRQDNRIIQKLHRRVFLDKVTRDDCSIYISFYVEAANRDAFMAVKQDLLLSFIDCVERNGARLARNKLQLEMLPTLPVGPMASVVDLPALPLPVDVSAGPPSTSPCPPSGSDPLQPSSSNGGSSSGTNGKVSSETSTPGKNLENKDAKPASNIVSAAGSSGTAGGTASSASSKSGSVLDVSKADPKPTVTASATASALASALANSPAATAKLATAVAPDEIITTGAQDGAMVLGSFDERF
jgi:MscS family membrane protein